MELILKAKDLDSYVSFLGRLNKLGKDYVVKNDVITPMTNGNVTGSGDKIPGIHYIQDPLFPTDEEDYVKDAIYIMKPLDKLLELFREIRTDNKDARKYIRYIRVKDGAYIGLVGMELIPIFTLEKEDEYNADWILAMEEVSTFEDLLTPHEGTWSELSHEAMVQIRDNSLMTITQKTSDGISAWARIAKSVFPMAGTSKKGSPIALNVKYDFTNDLGSGNDQVACLTLAADYKPSGSSTIIKVRCVHEYWVFIF